MTKSVGVVLVTYNRLSCLKTALEKYERQTVAPCFMLVVNNASTDGTTEFLESWHSFATPKFKRILVNMESNVGGSGGFSAGVSAALEHEFEYLFLADDDAYPDSNMIEELVTGIYKLDQSDLAAVSTANLNHGNPDLMHRCKVHQGLVNVKFEGISRDHYNLQFFPIDILTFVGACISRSAIEAIKLPRADYFIYFDDAEYSLRLRKFGKLYCIPTSVMHHDVGSDRRSGWKDYYDTRNWICLVHDHFPRRFYFAAIARMYLKRVSILALVFRGRDRDHRKMCQVAIKDGMRHDLGKNPKYAP